MGSAGVLLLQDIRAMFDSTTLGKDAQEGPYLPTKTIIERLTADPERPWADWKRGKPITDKGVADLLKEYRIISRNVGGRSAQSKGYRKADFEDAWERYVPPEAKKAEERKAGGQNSAILPSTRPPPCNDCEKNENSPVHQTDGRREKIDHLSSEINAVDAWTAKMVNPEPLISSSSHPADLDIPAGLLRCVHCNKPGGKRWEMDGQMVNLHFHCREAWVEEQERATTNARM